MLKITRFQRYYRDNRLKRKIETREYQRRVREAMIALMGGKCVKCGFLDHRALQVDHINGDGKNEKRKNTRYYYNVVMESFMKGDNKYQLLCANCNWIKREENNESKTVINF